MKKAIIFLLIILSIPILLNIEWIIGGYPWVKTNMELDVRNHLASKGINLENIQDLKAGYNRKFGTYTTRVTFHDDNNNVYYYDYINQEINQTGVSTSNRSEAKYLEK
ncbi:MULTISPECIES: DUF3139 domain-containing protein [Brevibacillus]|jgi:hypothetical protein|uniref:DUF3139 domain-containing protein n=1 Tax=Brevibacillus TaxID=55080 RepID=UPI00156AFE6F|nr:MULTISPECIES: DUF3139 domain-containing protein [Brevibacillus]MDR4998864.1 DUF3139 domain-containing protein [Brevibacillus parabrevis]UED67510.1 DUF3139 domain-containing protein [Brevibacillus sp. HD3.3A]WDV93760.1 DUF3139 domain-containing protein [Brevibacillus parabrevis]